MGKNEGVWILFEYTLYTVFHRERNVNVRWHSCWSQPWETPDADHEGPVIMSIIRANTEMCRSERLQDWDWETLGYTHSMTFPSTTAKQSGLHVTFLLVMPIKLYNWTSLQSKISTAAASQRQHETQRYLVWFKLVWQKKKKKWSGIILPESLMYCCILKYCIRILNILTATFAGTPVIY